MALRPAPAQLRHPPASHPDPDRLRRRFRRAGGDAPDPSSIPDFVSLGEAEAALQTGVKAAEQLVAACAARQQLLRG